MNCIVCNVHVIGEGVLSDGTAFHNRCYQNLVDRQSELEKILAREFVPSTALTVAHQRLSTLAKQERSERSLGARLRRAVNGEQSRAAEFAAEVQAQSQRVREIENNERALLASARALASAELSQLRASLTHMYDRWITYPPDWAGRRSKAVAAHPRCESCSGGGNIQVHHRRPVGQGGTHLAGNLVVLCRRCHERRHGGAKLDGGPSEPSGEFAEKVKIIQQAIDNGSCIQFHYQKYDGERSKRSMRPKVFEEVGDYNSLCVRGHCLLRNEERIFAVRRMTRVRPAANEHK